jgi:outer membrane lipoprotein carrier protein
MTFCRLSQKVPALLVVLSFLLFTLIGSSNTVKGDQESPAEIGARLQAKYNRIISLTFNFTQHTSGQLSGRGGQGNGQAYFFKTGKKSKMLWKYNAPDQQVILSDGTTLSMYFAKLKQMIITPANSLEQDLTYSFFSGAGDLENDFMIMPPDPEVGQTDTDKDSFKLIKLIPRTPRSQVNTIHVWITADSLIQRMEIRDYFDTVTILNFSNIKVDSLDVNNKQLINTLFSFTPPEGTEIIHQ